VQRKGLTGTIVGLPVKEGIKTVRPIMIPHFCYECYMESKTSELKACGLPWVSEGFLACGGNFRCWPKADTSSAVGRRHERRRSHYKDLTETGNRARKVSGTQGTRGCICLCYCGRRRWASFTTAIIGRFHITSSNSVQTTE